MSDSSTPSAEEILKKATELKKRHNWMLKWMNYSWYIEETEGYRNKSTALKGDTDELDSALNFHAELAGFLSSFPEAFEKMYHDCRVMREALEMKECPWPPDVFTEMHERDKIKALEALEDCKVTNAKDRLFGHWGRRVWQIIQKRNAEALSQVSSYPQL